MEHELKFKESSPDSRMVIPSEVLEASGISVDQCVELHQLRHCVAVLQGKLTAYELIEVILDLNKMSEFLVVQLAKACGTCDGCGDCANENKCGIVVPPELLDELGLPRNTKLEACADHDDGLILVGPACYEHDLTDIPDDFLEMLSDSGICLDVLEEHLMAEDTVYGE